MLENGLTGSWVDKLIIKAKRRLASDVIESSVKQAVDETSRNLMGRVVEAEQRNADGMSNSDMVAGMRRLTTTNAERLNPITADKINMLARYLYYSNPIARRLVEIPVDFGYNVSVQAEDTAHPKLQDIIDDFWNDPYNRMGEFVGQVIEIFNLHGELLMPAEVNPQNGAVTIKYKESIDIKSLERSEDDDRYVDIVEMKDKNNKPGKRYKVIRYNDSVSPQTIGEVDQGNAKEVDASGFRTGDAFYFRQCHLITGRGRSPLEPIIDWLDAHDQTLFDQLRNVALQGAFVWDVVLKNASEVDIQKRITELRAEGLPKPGSVRVHNDNEEWKAITPKIDSTISTELSVQVRKIIALCSGKSETWVAASDDVNRSTAEVADGPPHRHLERQQSQEEMMIRDIIDFVIDQAILHGNFDIDNTDLSLRAYSVQNADLSSKDNKETAEALKLICEMGLLATNDLEVADKDTIRNLWYQIAGIKQPLNIDENIAKDKSDNAMVDYKNNPLKIANDKPNPANDKQDSKNKGAEEDAKA